MVIFGNSDIGKRRENNEDSFRCGKLEDGTLWAVVCDGMGGAAGGEVASRIAAELVAEKIQLCYRREFETPSLRNLLTSAIITANVSIFDRAAEKDELEGMGTTIVAAIIKGGVAIVAHVGDSRAYLFRKDKTIQITKDHSLVQAMLDGGQITEDEYKNSALKNIILKCLGTNEIFDGDYIDYDVVFPEKGDVIMLCSDGLSNCLSNEEMNGIVFASDDLSASVSDLIEAANKNGGSDNITVVLIKTESDKKDGEI